MYNQFPTSYGAWCNVYTHENTGDVGKVLQVTGETKMLQDLIESLNPPENIYFFFIIWMHLYSIQEQPLVGFIPVHYLEKSLKGEQL